MRLLTWISRLFHANTPPATELAPEPDLQADPEAEAAVLADAHRKDILRRMRAAIFHDAKRNEFGVRLPDGRTLYCPTHSKAIALWYAEDARQLPGLTNVPSPASGKDEAKKNVPVRTGGRPKRPIEAIDPQTGEVRLHFDSTAAAGRAGFTVTSIQAVLHGRRGAKQHAGLLWRYSSANPDPKPPPHPIPPHDELTQIVLPVAEFLAQETVVAPGMLLPVGKIRKAYQARFGTINRSFFIGEVGAAGYRLVQHRNVTYVVNRALVPTMTQKESQPLRTPVRVATRPPASNWSRVS